MKNYLLLFFVLVLSTGVFCQKVTLQVYAPDGEPLAGAVILGTPQGWADYTNEDGTLRIEVADTVTVNYLGLQTTRLTWMEVLRRDGEIRLESNGILLTEVIVGDGRLRKDLSQQKTVVQALAMQRAQVSTPAEALAAEAGAYVQQSQLGGGSPVLRGFEANRVLLVIDGVRMNNAIYRSGHLQNAITVDENALSKLEVSYGAGALAYGSDALGGVIHFHTKNPLPLGIADRKWSGRAGYRTSTATSENSLMAELTHCSQRWSTYTALTASRFGNLRTGRQRPAAYRQFGLRTEYVARINGQDSILTNPDQDLQLGSGYEQLDVLQKINWQASAKLLIQFNLQYSTSGEVPRFDRLTERRNRELRFAEWYYGPQNRMHASLHLDWQAARSWADEVSLIATRQIIDEDRFDRRVGNAFREESLVNVQVNMLSLDANRKLGRQTVLQYGGLLRYDVVEARALRRSVVNGEVRRDVNSRYPSAGSNLSGADAFVQMRRHDRDSALLTEVGVRYSRQRLFARFGANDPIDWPALYLAGITNRNQSLNGAAGISWRMGRWQIRSHFASGFRAPNIDDFAKFRENDGFVQIPNPQLGPETSRSLDLSIAYRFKPTDLLELTAYRTWLNNAMVRQNFQLPNGDDFFVNTGDTLFVQAVVNADRAQVWGLSLAYQHRLNEHWRLSGQLHYTYGRRDFRLPKGEAVTTPLDHIPPAYGQLSVDYRSGRWEARLQSRFQAAKAVEDYAVSAIDIVGDQLIFNRLGTADNLELTPFDDSAGAYTGSYAWWVLNLSGAYRIGEHLRVRINVNNLFDRHYRGFASGISAPGRNLIAGLYAWF